MASSTSKSDKAASSATTVYNPYRIFQAAQRCMGDPSVVAKVLVELLGKRTGMLLFVVVILTYVRGGLQSWVQLECM